MIQTLQGYDPYKDTRICDVKIEFEMVDVDAAATAHVTVSDECAFSQAEQTHDRIETVSKKYATLEKDFWALDGSFALPTPEDIPKQHTGWWSESISDETGSFIAPPVLAFSWDAPQSSVGLTLYFDNAAGQYPTEFSVFAYDEDGTLLKQLDIENSGIRCEFDFPCEDYRFLCIQFRKTHLPYRRVRVCEVIFGLIKRFDKHSLVNVTLESSFSPKSESLPTAELTLTIDNSTAEWNMANPKGIYAYLQQTMPLDVYFVIDGASVFMGRFFFTQASAEDNALTAKITANDAVYWLDSVKFRGGENGMWTLRQAATAVLSASGQSIPVVMPEEIALREVGRGIDQNTSCRDALRFLAQAAGCSCFMNRNGTLVFFDPLMDQKPVSELNHDRIHAMPKITVGEEINTVELTVRNEYTQNQTETVYTATDRRSTDVPQTAEYENPVVSDGDAVAAWLLSMEKKRLKYQLTERGDPALDIADTVIIYDGYGGSKTALITDRKYTFDGGLKCEMEAIG